jgi:hypothetical protein
MKKLLLLLFIQFTLIKLNAQVKIGSPGNPDINAVLELAGTTKGLLLPRVDLTGTANATPLSAHTAGMVVYNTATIADVTPGYYYNNGTSWKRLAYSSETWGLNGNSATNPASQFLGTSDASDLAIRTNNLERIRISSAGVVDIGTNSLLANARMRIGGSVSGASAAILGINGTVNATSTSQTLYSFYNKANFGGIGLSANHIGTHTEMEILASTTQNVIGNNSSVTTIGTSYAPGFVVGVKGLVSRTSTGEFDGNYYGGQFLAHTTDPGSGNVEELFAIAGSTTLAGAGATNVPLLGTQINNLNIVNPNATVGVAYGIRNTINLNTAMTIPSVEAIHNTIIVNQNGILSSAYGSVTSMGTTNGGQIVNAYGNYLSSIAAIANISNYRGIFVGNIGLTSGTRRAFEYNGTGANDPVIINYDGSVQIGNTTPVTNAKLSINDGHLQSGQTSKPTIVASASMGTGATASLNDATDIAGIISLDFGTGAWSSGAQATITFNKIYANAPIVIITAASLGSALGFESQRPYVTSTTTGFTINFGIPATSGNLMIFNYQVIETTNN